MKESKSKPRGRKDTRWKLFDAINYRLFLLGVLLIVIGYIFMLQGPHDSFLSLHLSPIILVLGYCIMIPVAILFRPKKSKGD